VDGTLTREYDKLQNRVDLLQEQASDMEDLLAKKEARLYKQFQSMETALANLQTQQSALSALSSLTNISSYSYSNSK
jgi:flagellar capping protein FliD